jgi:hypothetical protein
MRRSSTTGKNAAMKKIILAAVIAAGFASPAIASGGMHCRTAGARPIDVHLGYGHVFGAPLFASSLLDNGRKVPVSHPQWWLDQGELRLVLTRPDAGAEEVRIVAKRSGQVYDGSLWRKGQRRWVRCREA